jgi:3-(3-hydroxy-phenyl)propionate hydroxylase
MFRDAVLDLSRDHEFARTLVNSGRLSAATIQDGSPLNTPDSAPFDPRMRPGAAAADAPIELEDGSSGWLLRQLRGIFTALVHGPVSAATLAQLHAAAHGLAELQVVTVLSGATPAHEAGAGCVIDRLGCVAERYDLLPGTVVLLRPDQHVCARWRQPSAQALRASMMRAMALN